MAESRRPPIVARRLARVFECSRLLDLNRGDAEFRSGRGGQRGQIIYVVDTNFVQAFLEPKLWHRCSRLFHDFEMWTPTPREEEWSDGEPGEMGAQVAAQATMLATEFVFSLASREGGRVYISPEHQIELERQIEALGKVWTDKFAQIRGNEIYFREAVNEAASIPTTREEILDLIQREGRLYVGDLKLDKMKQQELTRLAENHVVARICRLLAQDELVEPFEQIERLATDNPEQSVYPLEAWFELDQNDPRFLSARKMWRDLLQEEDDLRAKQSGRKERRDPVGELGHWIERGPRALDADAATLAHLTYLRHSKLTTDQRVVLITGDRLMLNAYRRWYAQHGEGVQYMLRPIAVYAPQFNPKEASVNLLRHIEPFESARGMLEASILTMTSTLKEHYFKTDTQRFVEVRARDRFCMDVEDGAVPPKLMDNLLPAWRDAAKQKAEELDAIVTNVRWLERLAIGSAPKLVRKRVDNATQRAADFLDRISGKEGAELEGEVERWLADSMARALQAGFRFSLPSAVAWITKFAKQASADKPRVPITLGVRVPYNDEQLAIEDWIARVAANDGAVVNATLSALSDRPAHVFALASWLAFRRNLWNDAVRFADFATRSAQGIVGQPANEALAYECLYLKALSLRVRLMSDAPAPQGSEAGREIDFWRRDLDAADAALTQCIAAHAGDPIKVLRACSERASVRLSYCAWAAVGDLGGLQTYKRERLELRDAFRGAVEDLEFCQAQLDSWKGAGANGTDSEVDEAILSWVRRQAGLAPECARVIYEILTEKDDPFRGEAFLPSMSAARRSLAQLWDYPDEPGSPILRAYALSARIRKGDAKAAEELLKLPDEASLALDAAMLHAIKERARHAME